MITRVAFLRAVNLGSRRVSNARLVELFEGLGYSDVWTHVNSGNVIFAGPGARAKLQQQLSDAIEQDVGFEVTTFVRSIAEVRRSLAKKVYRPEDGDTYFITFLLKTPTAAQVEAIEALSNDFEALRVDGSDVHWLMHGKSTDSKLVKRDWDRILGKNSSTSRNTTMLARLLERHAVR